MDYNLQCHERHQHSPLEAVPELATFLVLCGSIENRAFFPRSIHSHIIDRLHQIVIYTRRDDRIVFIFRMLRNELTHPCSSGNQRP